MSAPIRNRGQVLSEKHTDETHGIIIGMTKQVVETVPATLGFPKFAIDSTIPPTIAPVAGLPGGYLEVQSINKMRSITICSKLAMTQAQLSQLNITFPGTIDFQWPNVLLGVAVYRDTGFQIEVPSGTFSSVTVGGSFRYSGGPAQNTQDGPRSRSATSTDRSFWIGPPTVGSSCTKIQTSSGAVVVAGGALSSFTTYTPGGTVIDTTFSVDYRESWIPPVLSNNAAINYIGGGQARAFLSLPPSTPVAWDSDVTVTDANTSSPTVVVTYVPTNLVVGATLLGQLVSSISGTIITLAGNANANITTSTVIQVGTTTIIGAINIEQWRFGVWLMEVVNVTKP